MLCWTAYGPFIRKVPTRLYYNFLDEYVFGGMTNVLSLILLDRLPGCTTFTCLACLLTLKNKVHHSKLFCGVCSPNHVL
jgi:hypothetical protein